jgi:hypothetical protein
MKPTRLYIEPEADAEFEDAAERYESSANRFPSAAMSRGGAASARLSAVSSAIREQPPLDQRSQPDDNLQVIEAVNGSRKGAARPR